MAIAKATTKPRTSAKAPDKPTVAPTARRAPAKVARPVKVTLSGLNSSRLHPDAGLLALKLTFDQSILEEARIEKAYDEATTENQAQLGKELDATYAKSVKLARRIAATRASTLDGLFVKNAVWEWCRPDDPSSPRHDLDDAGNATTDMQILAGMMRDLGRMSGPPPSYPEDHPWVTVRRLSAELSAALARIDDGPVMAIIKPATEPRPIAWGDLDVFGDMLPLKPVEIEDKGDELQANISHLRHLMSTLTWDCANLDGYAKPDGTRNTELDHFAGLLSVAEILAKKLVVDVDEHVTHLYGVAGANRTNFEDVQRATRTPAGPGMQTAYDIEVDGPKTKGFQQVGEAAQRVVADLAVRTRPAEVATH